MLAASVFWVISLPISPIYFLLSIGVIIFLLSSSISKKKYSFKDVSVILLYMLYLTISQIYLNAKVSPLFNQVFSLGYFVLIYFSFYDADIFILKKASFYLLLTSLPLLLFESLFRIMNPIFEAANNVDYRDTNSVFYAYKLNSILNQDSNYVSVLILVLIFFSIYLQKYKKRWHSILQSVLIITLLLTLSRAAIIVFSVTVLYVYSRRFLKSVFVKVILFLSLIVFIYFVYLFALEDLSTQIKIASLFRSYSLFANGDIQTELFGIGIGNSANVLGGVSAHNIIESLILEQGIVGFILFFVVQFRIDKLSAGASRIVMIPFLLVSLSFFAYAITYYYAVLAIICLINKKTIEKSKYRLYSSFT